MRNKHLAPARPGKWQRTFVIWWQQLTAAHWLNYPLSTHHMHGERSCVKYQSCGEANTPACIKRVGHHVAQRQGSARLAHEPRKAKLTKRSLCSDLRCQKCVAHLYRHTGAIKWYSICSIFGNDARRRGASLRQGRKDLSINLGAASMRTPTPTRPPTVSCWLG
jgi:hypothetical protein